MFLNAPKRRLPQMGDPNFNRPFFTVPEFVVVDVARPVNHLACMFEYSIEFILDAMVAAVSDRTAVSINLYALSTRLARLIQEVPVYGEHGHYDRMVALEQSTLDLLDYFSLNRMYIYNRYLPYRFETLMNNGVLLLRRREDFDDFWEKIWNLNQLE